MSARPDGRRSLTDGYRSCGPLAAAHLSLLPSVLPGVRRVHLFDQVAQRANDLAEAMATAGDLEAVVTPSAQECVRDAGIVIPVTTTTTGYLPMSWLKPGTLVVHVSLDDLLPEVVREADVVIVDDWNLVRDDERRLLGRMYRAGALRGPDGGYAAGVAQDPASARVHGTLGQVMLGELPGRSGADEIVVCNPFGMAILDVAVAHRVVRAATRLGLGQPLSL